MSIRLKVLLACIGFAAIIVALGLFSRQQQQEMASLAEHLYDNTVGVDYAHKVETGFVRFATTHRDVALDAAAQVQLKSMLDNLDVVIGAGWIKKDEVCQGVKPGTVKVCG